MIKVSVIVPIYNSEKFLKKCLDSILNQTLQDIEIICVNDGSTDGSQIILDNYSKKDSRIKVIAQENQGLSEARNRGMFIATGEYVGFVDSDDWIDKDFYEKLYLYAKNYDADISVAGIKRLRTYKWKYHLKFSYIEATTNIDRKFLLCDVPDKCYVWNKIYKLSEIRKHNLNFEKGVFFEDRCFTAEVLTHLGKLVTVPDTYYNYWTNNKSIVKTNSFKKNVDSKYTKEKLMDFIREHNINIDHYYSDIKRFKFLGLTFLKVKYFKSKKEYLLLNHIKFERKNKMCYNNNYGKKD